MASSPSSSSSTIKSQHDVFLSFRGEDTRDNFTSHLYAALSREKIDTFIDDELRRGDEISPALVEAIKTARISVVIFSKDYASSRWCLEELAKILECKTRYGQVVIPVFYGVDPSDVRNRKRSYADAFAKVEEHYEGKLEMLGKWRNALTEAANLSGFHSKNFKTEYELVKDIVEYILKRLNEESPLIGNRDLVGIDSRIKYIEGLLHYGSSGVHKIGICGIGGIGKTTLAHAVFNKLFKYFEGSCFLQDIREESKKDKKLISLRRQLFSEILDDKNPDLRFTFTRKRFSRKRVLIVFDDVTDSEQIKYLIEDYNCLDSGSRIIITTRNKKVLKDCKVDNIYKTENLSDDVALQLFSQYAFGQSLPREDFMDLSSIVLKYVKGVPLALKIIGSFLSNREKKYWDSAIKRLKRIPHEDIQNVLKVSYDGLNDEEQHIFLDIACFFKGWRRDHVIEILDTCGYETHIGLQVLLEKSLITTSLNTGGYETHIGTIEMHDLLQEMGREIVRQESTDDPSKRSRLVHHADIYSVLSNNTGTEAIRSIMLDVSQIKELHLNPKAFSGMHNLRFLKVYSSTFSYDNTVCGFEVVESDFRELRCFCWHGYSSKSLPPNFQPSKLVALDMQCSNFEELLLRIRNLDNLKYINLEESKHQPRILDLSRAPNLGNLILQGCTSLVESLSSFRFLNKLVILNLGGCKSINTSPRTGILWKLLRVLTLSNLSNLEMVPCIPCSVEELSLRGIAIEEFPSIEHPSRLKELYLDGCSRLKSLSNDISKLECLEKLNLLDCSNLNMVPKISSKRIRYLHLDGTAIKELPSIECPSSMLYLYLWNCTRLESLPECIDQFKSLGSLDLSNCSKLDRLPESVGNLENLISLEVSRTAIREVPSSIASLNKLLVLNFRECMIREPLRIPPPIHVLTTLDLSDSCINELPNNIGQLKSLHFLYLSGNNFESLPASIKDLSKLIRLELTDCKRLQSLPELPHTLAKMIANGCTSLEAISGLPKRCPTKPADEAISGLPKRCPTWPNAKETFGFFNCLKVDFKAVMTDALLRIQQIADRFPCRQGGLIYFPGNEVPDWFSYKSSGSFLKLPADWFNHNLMGCVLCIVLSPNSNTISDEARYLNIEISGSINNENMLEDYMWPNYGQEGFDYLKSDHLFIICERDIMTSNSSCTVSSNNDSFIQFEVRDRRGKPREDVKVKQCGVRFLYKKDRNAKSEDRPEIEYHEFIF